MSTKEVAVPIEEFHNRGINLSGVDLQFAAVLQTGIPLLIGMPIELNLEVEPVTTVAVLIHMAIPAQLKDRNAHIVVNSDILQRCAIREHINLLPAHTKTPLNPIFK